MKLDYTFNADKHRHMLNGKALTGTSSVVDVLAKVLTWWAAGKAVETLGWVYPKIKKGGKVVGLVPESKRLNVANKMLVRIKEFTSKQYLDLLDKAYIAHSVNLKDTAEAGTNLHAELERFVKNEMNNKGSTALPDGTLIEPFDARIKPFIDWARYSVKRYLWSEVHCFDENLFVGGISDVGVELNAHLLKGEDGVDTEVPDGTLAIIDFKSAKEVYTSHYIQAGGYSLLVEKNGLLDSNGKLIGKLDKSIQAIIIVPFGADVVYPEIRMNIERYKDGFKHALYLYRLMGMDKSER